MAGQSSTMTIKEVSSTIKKLENNQHTNGNGACSGAETNQHNSHSSYTQKKKA